MHVTETDKDKTIQTEPNKRPVCRTTRQNAGSKRTLGNEQSKRSLSKHHGPRPTGASVANKQNRCRLTDFAWHRYVGPFSARAKETCSASNPFA
eukprot:5952706-Amphidinium_carterae.1